MKQRFGTAAVKRHFSFLARLDLCTHRVISVTDEARTDAAIFFWESSTFGRPLNPMTIHEQELLLLGRSRLGF